MKNLTYGVIYTIFFTVLLSSAIAQNVGDVFRAYQDSTIYYLAQNGKRYAFPYYSDWPTYRCAVYSWGYQDSDILLLDSSVVNTIPLGNLGGNILQIRPGTYLVQNNSDTAITYAITTGSAYQIPSDSIEFFYGYHWREKLLIVPQSYLNKYVLTTRMIPFTYQNGTLFKYANSDSLFVLNVNPASVRHIANSAGFQQNRFDSSFIVEAPSKLRFPMGPSISQKEECLVDPTKLMICSLTSAVDEFSTPTKFYIEQNHPNPFNPSTMINYQLPVSGFVIIKVYNLLGVEVTTLVDRIESAGYKSVTFDASNLPSGVYYYKISANASNGSIYTDAKKMILLR